MADKKLNEVPVVNDIVTIFGKRSNGEIVQIDKSNLATLLGELIGINDTWLRGMGDKIESIDKLTSGIYSIGEVLNIDGFNDYGLLVVFNSLLYKVQIIFGRYNGKIAYRFMISSDWDNWNVV